MPLKKYNKNEPQKMYHNKNLKYHTIYKYIIQHKISKYQNILQLMEMKDTTSPVCHCF